MNKKLIEERTRITKAVKLSMKQKDDETTKLSEEIKELT